MNKNINIAEILKDCPKDTKLYSPLFGGVKLFSYKSGGTYPIRVQTSDKVANGIFTEKGLYYEDYTDTECVCVPFLRNARLEQVLQAWRRCNKKWRWYVCCL